MRRRYLPALRPRPVHRLLLWVVVASGLAACVTEPESPAPPEGAMSYAFDGVVSGSVEISGAYDDQTPVDRSYAFARPTVQGDELGLFALRLRGEQIFDILYILIPLPSEPGSYPLEGGNLAYGMEGLGTYPEYDFGFETGEVVIAGLSDGRIQGSFTASGHAFGEPGWDPFNPDIWSVEISGGSFDLPVIPPS